MKPVVSVAEMKAIDNASTVAEAELIHRAAWAVSRAAISLMGGTYGRRVTIVAGPGNNGADGRQAAVFLEDRGVRTKIVTPGELQIVPACDLVVDAAFGTGFRGEYEAPNPNGAIVLAVDVPSGVNGDTGVGCDGAVWADYTVTFAALKPGHLLHDGPDRCGELELVDIGLDVSRAAMHLFEPEDLGWVLPRPARDTHKWKSSVGVIAGSPGMMGASRLATLGAQRAGAGMVRVLSPGVSAIDAIAGEAVAIDGIDEQWSQSVADIAERLQALVIGPGLGRSYDTREQVRRVLATIDKPVVLDADGLVVMADEQGRDILRRRKASTVLTPHDGEFEKLAGHMPAENRPEDVRQLAKSLQCVVLLKGSTTTIADPTGQVYFANAGGARLATAGTGDVLAGIVGAFLAQGVEAPLAAVTAAYVHGAAARKSYERGLIASDLPENVAELLSNR